MSHHITLIFVLIFLWTPCAFAQDQDLAAAQSFAEQTVNKGIALLSDKSLTQEAQKSVFRAFLAQNFAMKTVARFAIGRHWNEASPAEQAEYETLFEDMIVVHYTAQFKDYQGQVPKITGVRAEGDKDAIVSSLIPQPQNKPNIRVDWRIRYKNEGWRVVDVIVEGVSMVQTYRADFDSVIQSKGITGFLAEMRARATLASQHKD